MTHKGSLAIRWKIYTLFVVLNRLKSFAIVMFTKKEII